MSRKKGIMPEGLKEAVRNRILTSISLLTEEIEKLEKDYEKAESQAVKNIIMAWIISKKKRLEALRKSLWSLDHKFEG
ncbi:hypothetical protein DRN34_00295 [Thermococci archaeon]|nr:MAG: hypothetical protein DRN34_00295 [Thermococci archaeon]